MRKNISVHVVVAVGTTIDTYLFDSLQEANEKQEKLLNDGIKAQVQEKVLSVEDDSDDEYVPICWPDIQYYMDLEGFDEHAYLINDEQGLDDFGSSAYMVEKGCLNSL